MRNLLHCLLIVILSSFYAKAQTDEISDESPKNEFGLKIENLFFSTNQQPTQINFFQGNISFIEEPNYQIFKFLYKRRIKNNYLRIENLSTTFLEDESYSFVPNTNQLQSVQKVQYSRFGLQVGYEFRKKRGEKISFYVGPLLSAINERVKLNVDYKLESLPPQALRLNQNDDTWSFGLAACFGAMYNLGKSPFYVFGEVTPTVYYNLNKITNEFVNIEINTETEHNFFSTSYIGTGYLGIALRF